MPKKIVTRKLYTINLINSSGHCYRTIMGCPYSIVKEWKQTAKALGEKIEYEYERTIKEDYSY